MASEERREFPNGLVAIADPILGKRKVQLYAGINVGAMDESHAKKGGAHLLEHLMFKSNEFRSAAQIVRDLEFCGIVANAATSQSETLIDLYTPPEKLPVAMDFALQAVVRRQFDEKEFLNEKEGPVTQELVNYERNPSSRFATRLVCPRTFAGTALEDAVIGTYESVRALTLDDIRSLQDKFYVARNMMVVATGNVDKSRFFDEVERTFGTMKSTPPISVRPDPVLWTFRPGVEYAEWSDLSDVHAPEQDQAFAYVVFKVVGASHEDSAGLEFLSCMAGTGFTSRLMQELRERRGIGYTPDASYSGRRGYATMSLGLPGIHPRQIEMTIDVVLAVARSFYTEPLDSSFLEGKKTQFLSHYSDTLDSCSGRANLWMGREFDHPHYDFRTYDAVIKSLSEERLHEVAQKYFSQDPLIVIASAPGYKNQFDTN